MKKFKTEEMVIHLDISTSYSMKRIVIEMSERGQIPHQVQFMIPNDCSKKSISDSGLTKHILNYFIKD